jgi:Chaperone of endosialidase
MKKLVIPSLLLLNVILSSAQAPPKMSYQSVVRNSSGAVVASGNVGIRISLLQGSATGTTSFAETHTVTTDANGIASLEIGGGTPVTSTLASINWASGPYFIKTETDPAGGTSYTISGTSQLLSVPYALYSANGLPAGTTVGNTLYWNGTSWVSNGNVFNNGGNVGIGTIAPSETLDINGSARIRSIAQNNSLNQILAADANGKISWKDASSFDSGLPFILEANGNNLLGVGTGALTNSTGILNTAFGVYAMGDNTTGTGNTAIGTRSMWNNTTGNYNTAVGLTAMYDNLTGSYNSVFGSGATTINDVSNATAIGAGAQVNTSNKVRIGSIAVTVIEGQVSFTAASDKRFKKDIKPIEEGVEFIKKLKPMSYRLKTDESGKLNWGFIAQDIEALIGTQNAVLTIGGDSLRSLGLRYTDFVAPLVKAVQEQQQTIEALQAKVQELTQQLNAQQSASTKSKKEKEILKSDFESRLKKLEEMLNLKAKK